VRKVINIIGNNRKTLRAAWQPQIIFSVKLGGMTGLLLINGLLSHRADWLQGAAIFGLLWAAFIVWFRGFALELTGEDLWYSAPLSRRARMPLASIQGIHYRRIVSGPRSQSTGSQTVVVELAGNPKSEVVVNARVFPYVGLKQLFDEIASRGIPVTKQTRSK
jgi:hypothetical protein